MGLFNNPKEFHEPTGEEVEDIEENIGEFTVGEKAYDIQFNQKQIRLYESSHPPIMATFAMYHGMLSISDLIAITAYGMREHGGNFVPPKTAMKMAEKLIEENGYAPTMELVITAIERDCNFLFAGTDD